MNGTIKFLLNGEYNLLQNIYIAKNYGKFLILKEDNLR